MLSIRGDMLAPFSEVFFLFILVVATYLKKTIIKPMPVTASALQANVCRTQEDYLDLSILRSSHRAHLARI
jgi:hypothetical protein